MHDQNPYAAPQSEEEPTGFAIEGDPSIVREGNRLLVPEGALLPTRCVSCNRPAELQMKVRVWPSLTRKTVALLLASLFLAAIAFLILDWSSIEIGLSLLSVIFVPVVATLVYLHFRSSRNFQFYICAHHNLVRYLSGGMSAVLYLGFISAYQFFPELAERVPIERPLMPAILIVFVVLAFVVQQSHVQIRGSEKPHGWVEFRGFGKEYLNNFSTTDTK